MPNYITFQYASAIQQKGGVLFSKAGDLFGLRFRWAYFSFSYLSMAGIYFRSMPKQETIFAP